MSLTLVCNYGQRDTSGRLCAQTSRYPSEHSDRSTSLGSRRCLCPACVWSSCTGPPSVKDEWCTSQPERLCGDQKQALDRSISLPPPDVDHWVHAQLFPHDYGLNSVVGSLWHLASVSSNVSFGCLPGLVSGSLDHVCALGDCWRIHLINNRFLLLPRTVYGCKSAQNAIWQRLPRSFM